MMEKLIKTYLALDIDAVIDKQKFNAISIVHHSTVLEGSTLTAQETSILINDGLTPKGKPLVYSQMVANHYSALQYTLQEAEKKAPISLGLIKAIAGLVMKDTGAVYNTIFGQVDASKGEFRKGNVTAGVRYFPDHSKVERYMGELVNELNKKLPTLTNVNDQINLSFDAHFNLVSIHPFYDGNGRTSRLLMNYIQKYYELPLAVVNSQDKGDYIEALEKSREKEDINIFREFMKTQYTTHLKTEIEKYTQFLKEENQGQKKSNSKGFSLMF